MPIFPERFDEAHVNWIYGAIRSIACGSIADEVLVDLESDLSVLSLGGDDIRSRKSAWILSRIALAAIDALEGLPMASQMAVAQGSEAWPAVVRPKVSTALKQLRLRLEELHFAENLSIDLNHSAGSPSGAKVPVAMSYRPGIGLANYMHEELLKFKEANGLSFLDTSALQGFPIESISPDKILRPFLAYDYSPHDEESEQPESQLTHPNMNKVVLDFQLMLLVAGLTELDESSVDAWSLAAIRLLQHQYGGALVQAIPQDYWHGIKNQAAKAQVNSERLLETELLRALKSGFSKLAKS
jgi:hypothetical protein